MSALLWYYSRLATFITAFSTWDNPELHMPPEREQIDRSYHGSDHFDNLCDKGYDIIRSTILPLKTLRTLLLLAVTTTLLFACRKNERFTEESGIRLEFSQDSVLFDTVFTTVGTITKRFTARNPSDNAVRITVGLEGGAASDYRINVDGATGTGFQDVEVLGGDSIYIFVEATLGPGSANTPFIIEDRILFNTNGSEQEVRLLAWGQDAIFYPNPNAPVQFVPGLPQFSYIAGGYDQNGAQICGQNVIWTAEKPIVLLKYGVVDSCNSLTIEEGARIYVHGGAGLWVYRGGQITAIGTAQNPSIPRDRRERILLITGQWTGLDQ